MLPLACCSSDVCHLQSVIDNMRSQMYISLWLVFILSNITVSGDVFNVTKENYQEYFKMKTGSLFLYVTKEDCEKCDLLYYKFIIVSQIFVKHKEISFGKVRDSILVEAFEVESFPAIVYYEGGSATPKVYGGDITVTQVSKFITHTVKIDPHRIGVKYTLGVTFYNFQELMNTDKLTRLVLLHHNDDLVELDEYDELAETFENELDIVFATINIDKQTKVKSWYRTDRYPALYWYPKGKVDHKMRYGGELKLEQMIKSVNQEYGYFRTEDGSLNSVAGLIMPLNEIIKEHGKDLNEMKNVALVRLKLVKEIERLPVETDLELAEYYVHLIDEMEEDRTVDALFESRNRLYRQMLEVQPFRLDQLYRQKNIANKVISLVVDHERHVSSDNKDASDSDDITADHGIQFHEEF